MVNYSIPLSDIIRQIPFGESDSAEIYPWIEFNFISGIVSEDEAYDVQTIGISLEDHTLTIFKQST